MNKFIKKALLISIDILIVLCSFILAIFLSASEFYDCIREWWYIIAAVVCAIITNSVCGLYKRIWKYVDSTDILRLMIASTVEVVGFSIIAIISVYYNIQWLAICSVLYVMLLAGSRFAVKILEILEIIIWKNLIKN